MLELPQSRPAPGRPISFEVAGRETVSRAEECLARLSAHPFKRGLGDFILALERALAVPRAVASEALAYDASVREPWDRDAEDRNRRYRLFLQDCEGRPALGECAQRQADFAEEDSRLEARERDIVATFGRFRERYESAVPAVREAMERGCRLLEPTQLEESFQLLALALRRTTGLSVQEAMRRGVPHIRTDCEAMAELFDALGQAVDWDVQEFAKIAGYVLSGEVSGLFRVITLQPAGSARPVRFGDHGFKREFLDDEGSTRRANQVRHFTGYFILGLYRGGWVSILGLFGNIDAVASMVDDLVARIRDLPEEPGDYRLGLAAAGFGQRVAKDPALLRTIGSFVRSEICEHLVLAQPLANAKGT